MSSTFDIAKHVSQALNLEGADSLGQNVAAHVVACQKPAQSKSAARRAAKKKAAMERRAAREKEAQERQKQKQSSSSAASSSSSSSKKGRGKKGDTLRLRREYHNPTPPGEKKDLSGEFPSEYDPPAVEAAWYEWWEAKGFFRPRPNADGKRFVMVIPPPNVTGSLHLGHALTNSIEDCITRWHRMCGDETLWVPGTDHAGIATQAVVEKQLAKQGLPTRQEMGREKFLEHVYKWKDQKGSSIINQLRRLGSSVDWSRQVFTLDEKRTRAVTEAFVQLYDKGVIYRANRLVNWCCALKTAISDIEVDTLELTKPTRVKIPGYDKPVELGVMDHFAYEVLPANDQGEGEEKELLVVATTRIETMLGDTAVAVHPEDPRFKHLHGRFVKHPFIEARKIPIVLDPELVDMELGTGCVKITPAHDPNDYGCGMRHNLEFINILNPDGTLNEAAGEFAGMKRYHAREAVRKRLEALGLYHGKKPHAMAIGTCSRSGDVIEPYMVPQWYMKMQEMADKALQAQQEGDLCILPENQRIHWQRWLEDSPDWCISRQLWWGHRIPAYLVWKKDEEKPSGSTHANWVIARSDADALEAASAKLQVPPEQVAIEQDEDVLDTWFSSGLFPFSVFGWPEQTDDLQRYFPTTVLETGWDILFFWVARMVVMSQALMGCLPFKQVFLHSMVRDAHGRKMSKSLGNVLDPIDVIEGIRLEDLHEKLKQNSNLPAHEINRAIQGQKKDYPGGISECGTDALRFALCSYTGQGRDINLNVNKVVATRHWCNKLWNAFRFVRSMLPADFHPNADGALGSDWHAHASPADRWVISRLHYTVSTASSGMECYDFNSATEVVYNFWLKEFCAFYLEAIKPLMYDEDKGEEEMRRKKAACAETLYTCVETGLRLVHPFMPYISEELWQRLPRRSISDADIESICIAPWPTADASLRQEALETDTLVVQHVIHSCNSLKTRYGLGTKKVPIYLKPLRASLGPLFVSYQAAICALARANSCSVLSLEGEGEPPIPRGCALDVVGDDIEIHVHVAGLVDWDREIARLRKSKAAAEKRSATIEKRKSMANYETKVPLNVRQRNDADIASLNSEITRFSKAIEDMQRLANEEKNQD